MQNSNYSAEFRFYYFTNRYEETVAFYKDTLQLAILNSWDRSAMDKGTIFVSPNGAGLVEIEKGNEVPVLQGGLYIQVEDVDAWYYKLLGGRVNITEHLTNTSYGHRSFKFADPNGLVIGLFRYLERP